MPPIETIVKPYRNRISVSVPKEYGSYSFQVILVPLKPAGASAAVSSSRARRPRRSFVDALLSCPKLGDGESLDVSRDPADVGRDVDL